MITREKALILNRAKQATTSPDHLTRLVAAGLLLNHLEPLDLAPEELKIQNRILKTDRPLKLV